MQSRGKIAALIFAIIVIIGGAWYFVSRPGTDTPSQTQQLYNQGAPAAQPQNNAPQQPSMQPVVVQLNTQNNSGEKGTATLSEENGKTKVVLSVTGQPANISQPAHIHTGTCAALGGVKYTLSFPVNGTSETTINTTLGSLLSQGPLAINVHKYATEINAYVACGDLPAPTAAPASAASASPSSMPKAPSGGVYSY